MSLATLDYYILGEISVCIFAIGFAAFDDWETHQLYSENRDKFHSQWRATPSGSFMPVDYKEVELSNLTYSEFRRSIGVAKLSHTNSHTSVWLFCFNTLAVYFVLYCG